MKNSEVITVVAAIADKENVVFYTDTGDTRTVAQSDPRLITLLNKINPELARGRKVTVSLEDYSLYEEFEKQSNGLVRFFRAAKKAVQSIVEAFVPLPVEPDDSTIEEDNKAYAEPVIMEKAPDPVGEEAAIQAIVEKVNPEPPPKPRYEDVKQHLKPVKNDEPIAHDETLVAVINGVAIPGIEGLKPYIQNALRTNSPNSVIKFLERIARVIDQRGHSIPDLMSFLSGGDLPLAEDGSIIGYKILRKSTAHPGFTFVDCYSGKVHQRVGTKVNVAEDMVDKNRSNECSNGLHVARRGYIGSFSGDTCTMIKMNPEDVIAVPHGDARKVRVCAYHIIFELSPHVYNVLRANKPMTSDPEAAAMLAKAISGDHVGVLEEVWIGGSKGGYLTVKNRMVGAEAVIEKKKTVIKAQDQSTTATAFDDAKNGVNPKELNKKIRGEKAKAVEEKAESKATGNNLLGEYSIIIKNNDIVGAQNLLDRKKRAKKSWSKFGLPDDAGSILEGVISGFNKEIVQATEEAVKKDEPINRTGFTKIKGKWIPDTILAKPKKKDQKADKFFGKSKKVADPKDDKYMGKKPATSRSKGIPEPKTVAAKTWTAVEEARNLFESKNYEALKILKKTKKKSWETLGFNDNEITKIIGSK